MNGPKLPFRPQELTVIEDFLGKGGRAFFMVDPVYAQLSLLPSWFQERYGVMIGSDVLLSQFAGNRPTEIYLLPDVSQVAAQITTRTFPEDFPGCYSKEQSDHARIRQGDGPSRDAYGAAREEDARQGGRRTPS